MTAIERAKVLVSRMRKLREEGTPTPWIYHEVDPEWPLDRAIIQDESGGRGFVVIRDKGAHAPGRPDWKDSRGDQENFALIAAAVNGLPAVIEMVEGLIALRKSACVSGFVWAECDINLKRFCDSWEPLLDRTEGKC